MVALLTYTFWLLEVSPQKTAVFFDDIEIWKAAERGNIERTLHTVLSV